MPDVLWWGRFDPEYARNRILRGLLKEIGWQIFGFQPRLSGLADWEARLHQLQRPDLVWVPCFRQRDLAAACRWAHTKNIPVLFDPLISAYDKQVFERAKFPPESRRARRLQAWERRLFQSADIILADTPAHADYFAQSYGLDTNRLHVVYVGAEEALFKPAPMPDHADGSPIEVLFYGSFIELQAPQVIVEAARRCQGHPVSWTLLGKGPLRGECERLAMGLSNVRFENPVPYAQLPSRIRRADILLGVFDVGAKASRVIPNKVFQALACGRPVLTRASGAYPEAFYGGESGIAWVEAGNAESLARKVAALAADPERLPGLGHTARVAYETWFSKEVQREQLTRALLARGNPLSPSLEKLADLMPAYLR